MRHKLKEILQKAKYESDPSLAENVWRAVIARDKHINRLKLWAFAFIGLASLAGLVPALKALLSDLAQSGFSEYFSLIFSDSGLILSYWKELFFSLAESLPILSVTLSLTLIFIFFLSLKYTMKQIIKSQLSLSF
jgi:hypothetical protein